MNYRILTRLLIFFLISFIQSICLASSVRTKVAVLDFELYGDGFSTNQLGTMVSEWFVTSFVNDGRFEVIERTQLTKILEEQKLGATGILDDSSASKLGKILGARIVVTGSVLNISDEFEINSRIINVEDGSILAAESIRCASKADLQPVVQELTKTIMKNFPLTGYVVKRDDENILIDIGKATGVHLGMEFDVFKEGKVIKHPVTGKVLDTERVVTGRIQVVQFQGNLTEAIILREDAGGVEYGHMVQSISVEKMSESTSQVQEPNVVAKSKINEDSEKTAVSDTRPQKRSQIKVKPKRKEVWTAMTPNCPDLLKAWKLGDSSVMQRYLKECTK